jgi:cytochrome c biogenesis protein CcdA
VNGPVAYAFTLGLVAAVNPCGFPLLPAYLALFAGDTSGLDGARRTVRALVAGACMTVGFVLAFGVVGILAESGIALVTSWAPWVMILVGVALAVLGIRGLAGRALRVPVPVIRFAGGRTAMAMGGFGVAYAVASLSCALPLFLAGVAGAFTRLGPIDGWALFLSYALGMGVFVTGASIIAAHADPAVLRRIRPLGRVLPTAASILVTLVGCYLVYFWASELLDPAHTPVVVAFIDAVQSAISQWLASSALAVGCTLGVLVLVGIGLVAIAARRTETGRPETGRTESRTEKGEHDARR